jgi:putative nucleotidyltransferase with HDIG domain
MITNELLQTLHHLPQWPEHMHRLLAAINDDEINSAELAEEISAEQALVARLLRVANSSFYGVSGKIETPLQAINMIGLNNTRNLVIAAAAIANVPKISIPTFDLHNFWGESFLVASIGKALALQMRVPANTIFTGGILHDIGKLVLVSTDAAFYTQLLGEESTNMQALNEKERERFGADHAMAGAALANYWNFPDTLIQMLQDHHSSSEDSPVAAKIVHVADEIAHWITCAERADSEPDTTPIEKLLASIAYPDFGWRAAARHAQLQTRIFSSML